MGTLLSSFRTNAAIQLKESFALGSEYITYCFFGKTLPFADGGDTNPPSYSDNELFYNETWRQMISFKKLTSSDITLAIRNIEWVGNTIYDQYDDVDSNMFLKDFYVMNAAYGLYKCIDNNGGVASTEEPLAVTTDIISLSDGYKWKYMATLDAVVATKFLNNDLIPVKILTADDGSNQWEVQEAAIAGTLDRVSIEKNTGTFSTTPIVTIEGDGTGAEAVAEITGNTLTKIIVTAAGSGYTQITVKIAGREDDTELRGILSPANGHGKNIVEELFGFNNIINFQFDGSESGNIMTGNDYRNIGIMRNPTAFGTSTTIDVSSGSQTLLLDCLNPTLFDLDEEIIGSNSGASGILVYDDGANAIHLNNIKGTFQAGETIIGQDSLESNTISTITDWDLNRFSGLFIYDGYRVPVDRTDLSIETYKLNIYF